MGSWLVDNALYILVALGTIFTYIWMWSFKDILALSSAAIFIITIAFTGMDAVCVKLFAVIEYWDISAADKMSLFGAIFFMPFVIWAAAKIVKVKPLLLFDICTPGFIFMFMCGRMNCLAAGCCYGIYMTQNFRWPVREAEITLYLILLIIFCLRLKKGKFTGTNYALFLLAYGTFRFAVEFVRWFPDQDGLWHRGHICAAIAFTAGLIWILIIKKQKVNISIEES